MSKLTRSNKIKASLQRCHGQLLHVLAYMWRRLLVRTTFVAITGSVGKTTTKECIAAILSSRFPTVKTRYNQNDFYGVPRTILNVRPWHRFAVLEVGTERPGLIKKLARLARPDIAVVLTVAGTHTNAFSSLDETAAEKARLLEALPHDGLAILNADDPRVRKMAAVCRCRVKTFGRTVGCDLWADEISSKWPARLTLRVHTGSEVQWIKTKLVGEHWVNSILAALLVARSCGMPLEAVIAELERVKPFMARMQPVLLPCGATMIRDEASGSPDTLTAALQVLGEADAVRRVLVMSDLSDLHDRPRVRFKELGKVVVGIADLAVFVSEHGHYAAKSAVARGMKPECVLALADLSQAAQYLKSELREGDVVLLKGRGTDHLSRLFFGQFGTVGCWKTKCDKRILCDICEELQPRFDVQTIGG
jgi:UDP-N-acetylmuramoyl-tripeptide--D-alanyl-D-alanine ligase